MKGGRDILHEGIGALAAELGQGTKINVKESKQDGCVLEVASQGVPVLEIRTPWHPFNVPVEVIRAAVLDGRKVSPSDDIVAGAPGGVDPPAAEPEPEPEPEASSEPVKPEAEEAGNDDQ